MAEEDSTPSQSPPQYLEVNCGSSGKTYRFAAGTDAGFAVALINRKLKGSAATHIEAVKGGEEPIAFGPNAILSHFGEGWKLQTQLLPSEEARNGPVRGMAMDTPGLVSGLPGDEKRVSKQISSLVDMVQFRGLHTVHRRRTTFAHRGRLGLRESHVEDPQIQEPPPEEQPQHVEEVEAHTADGPALPPPFLGGPEDTSILRSFGDHVATYLWTGQDRGALKAVAHGRKVKDSVVMNETIRIIVEKSGLAPLLSCSHSQTDKGLCSAFAERWHKETNTFHLPVGEMTITLDDVSALLHIPITGSFFRQPVMDRDTANACLVQLLGVSYADAVEETTTTRGAHVRLGWLETVYEEQFQQQHWENAARALLLRLVGSTLFTDKSATSVDVAFLELFRDLDACGTYAWGVGALAYLYDQLSIASFHGTKQLAGYLTLLQGWVFEHFPAMGCRSLDTDYIEEAPRASRWRAGRGPGQVVGYRTALDDLTLEDVCWTPYTAHREARPFQLISLFSGYIRWGPLHHVHLPERVLRQYGHVQSIPRSPRIVTKVHTSHKQMHHRWVNYFEHLVPIAVRGDQGRHPGDCVDGYLEWFFRISHPFLIPARSDMRRRVLLPQPAEASSNGTSSQTMEGYARISQILQSCKDRGLIVEGTELLDAFEECLRIAHSQRREGLTYQRKRVKTRSDA